MPYKQLPPPPTPREILDRLNERQDDMTTLDRVNRAYLCHEILLEMEAEAEKEKA